MKKEIKTDADVIVVAREIRKLQKKIDRLLGDILDSKHPNADHLYEDLLDQCSFGAWPTHVVHKHLEHPERWETDYSDAGLTYKGKQS